LIGCIIGRQSAKINEIRQMLGHRSKLWTQWKDLLTGRLPPLNPLPALVWLNI
jgi:hypothetical protein